MEIKVLVGANIQVPGGPTLNMNWSVPADGYDRLVLKLGAGEKQSVNLLPAAKAAPALLLISSTKYDELITCTLDPGGAAKAFKLTSPLLASGGDLAAALAASAASVEIENKTTGAITVDIFIVRVITA
ncbi:hypothetical protein P12x_000788 [Tundrisphaera lichenicola]|uniref:hypothetical protein n=1 Tax=Tundrisphaera lichenicola TaxID=2029860 RepID=UPI003EB97444